MTHEELTTIISNWEKTNLIENFEDKEPIALCLQSQLGFNKTTNDGYFNRLSIPLVVRVFSESKAFRNNTFTNFFESKRPEYLFFGTTADEQQSGFSLEEEAKQVSEIAFEIRRELDEAFRDKRDTEIVFHGFGRLVDGTIFMAYN